MNEEEWERLCQMVAKMQQRLANLDFDVLQAVQKGRAEDAEVCLRLKSLERRVGDLRNFVGMMEEEVD